MAKPEPVDAGQGSEIEIADGRRAGAAIIPGAASRLLKQVNVLAKEGYRYFGPYVAFGALDAMMEKCGQECEVPFEYRYFDVHNMGPLVKELNERGTDGFRVVPKTLRIGPHFLERGGTKKETFAYHVLLAKDPVALEQALNAPENEGYEPTGYEERKGFLVLEKLTAGSGAP